MPGIVDATAVVFVKRAAWLVFSDEVRHSDDGGLSWTSRIDLPGVVDLVPGPGAGMLVATDNRGIFLY